MKKILFITLTTLLIFTTACGKKKEEVETKSPTIVDKINTANVDDISIIISPVEYNDGFSTIYATVTNNGEKDELIDVIEAKFVVSNEESYIVKFSIGEVLKPNQSVYITNKQQVDLSKAISVEFNKTGSIVD